MSIEAMSGTIKPAEASVEALSAVVTEEERAQIERLACGLANGVKENLVERVWEWSGVQSSVRARERTGASVLSVKAIRSRDPQHRPSSLARSPAPRVHAATKAARKAFYEIYTAFVSAFREASERLQRGDRNAPFPVGSFPPALPFVAG